MDFCDWLVLFGVILPALVMLLAMTIQIVFGFC